MIRWSIVFMLMCNLAFADTMTFYSDDGGDGTIDSGWESTWTTARNLTSGTTATTFGSIIEPESNYFSSSYGIQRGFIPFNTSDLPNNANITAATLRLYQDSGAAGESDVEIVQTSQASPTTLAVGDYSNVGSVSGGSVVFLASAGARSVTLNSTGRGWINKEGWTYLGTRHKYDFDNTTPTGFNATSFYSADYSGDQATYHPRLVVTYTLPDTISQTVTTTLM